MNKKQWFIIFSWGTVIIAILVIFDSFNYFIIPLDFYFYLILISGIIGIIGALISLGIFPTIGGLAICISMIYLSIQYGFEGTFLMSFLKATALLILGCGMILTFEEPIDLQSYELPRLGLNKTEFLALKNLGITTLKELIEEKGNEEEISSITSIKQPDLKSWIHKAEEILENYNKVKKEQLKKDFKQKYKK
ncbi:MAG: hypothetical protein ACFFD2_27730 [Promethearchaeota archaeon]